ncbi:hypothetical protein LCA12_005186, partial [Salmonella enterica]|nr:hypothetical protein [Salmonella enterica]
MLNATNGTVTLNGSSRSGIGVRVQNAELNASRADIMGSSTVSGTGFSLTGTTLAGALADLTNVTLSSAGSAAGVTNTLDSSIVTDTNRDNLLAKHIDNMTTVDMAGNKVFDDSTKTDKGWTADYTSDTTPNGGWIFNNTSVTAGGDVNLKGAGFTNSTVTVTDGSLSIDNRGPVSLTGTTITVNDGAVNVHADAGNISLNKGNISAKSDITLQADNGSITISGTNATATANITSSEGNIAIKSSTMGNLGLLVNNVSFMADDNVSFDGDAALAGARIHDANITANKGHINLNASALRGGFDYVNGEYGGLLLYGNLLFKAGTGTTINATHASHMASYSPPVPLVLEGVNLTFDGGADIKACGSYAGIVVSASDMVKSSGSKVFVKNGDVNINATLNGQAQSGPTGSAAASASGGIVFNNGYGAVSLELNVDNGSNITISANSSANKSGPFAAFAAATPEATAAASHHNGFVFSGGGNVYVNAISDSADAVNLRLFNNEQLTGNLFVSGVSNSGVGVNFNKYLSTKVSNAIIDGVSQTGVGVLMTAKNGNADLNNNTVSGSTITGEGGVMLSGSNVTITNGTLLGKALDGNGSGVSMNGGNNFILDGAHVSGYAVNGSGVSVNGTIIMLNGTVVEGHVSGSGDGVAVSGHLTADNTTQVTGAATQDGGTGVTLNGAVTGGKVDGVSGQGTGLQLADNAVVTDATLKGTSTSGSG